MLKSYGFDEKISKTKYNNNNAHFKEYGLIEGFLATENENLCLYYSGENRNKEAALAYTSIQGAISRGKFSGIKLARRQNKLYVIRLPKSEISMELHYVTEI